MVNGLDCSRELRRDDFLLGCYLKVSLVLHKILPAEREASEIEVSILCLQLLPLPLHFLLIKDLIKFLPLLLLHLRLRDHGLQLALLQLLVDKPFIFGLILLVYLPHSPSFLWPLVP